MSATATKAARQSKPATKAKAAAAKPAAKPARKPKVEPQPEPEQAKSASRQKTELRRIIHEAIESAAESGKPLTIKKVAEQFGEYGKARVGRMMARHDYLIEGSPAVPKGLSFSDGPAVLAYAEKVLAAVPSGKIKVLHKFPVRGN